MAKALEPVFESVNWTQQDPFSWSSGKQKPLPTSDSCSGTGTVGHPSGIYHHFVSFGGVPQTRLRNAFVMDWGAVGNMACPGSVDAQRKVSRCLSKRSRKGFPEGHEPSDLVLLLLRAVFTPPPVCTLLCLKSVPLATTAPYTGPRCLASFLLASQDMRLHASLCHHANSRPRSSVSHPLFLGQAVSSPELWPFLFQSCKAVVLTSL